MPVNIVTTLRSTLDITADIRGSRSGPMRIAVGPHRTAADRCRPLPTVADRCRPLPGPRRIAAGPQEDRCRYASVPRIAVRGLRDSLPKFGRGGRCPNPRGRRTSARTLPSSAGGAGVYWGGRQRPGCPLGQVGERGLKGSERDSDSH
jgi:hypothetical protein